MRQTEENIDVRRNSLSVKYTFIKKVGFVYIASRCCDTFLYKNIPQNRVDGGWMEMEMLSQLKILVIMKVMRDKPSL